MADYFPEDTSTVTAKDPLEMYKMVNHKLATRQQEPIYDIQAMATANNLGSNYQVNKFSGYDTTEGNYDILSTGLKVKSGTADQYPNGYPVSLMGSSKNTTQQPNGSTGGTGTGANNSFGSTGNSGSNGSVYLNGGQSGQNSGSNYTNNYANAQNAVPEKPVYLTWLRDKQPSLMAPSIQDYNATQLGIPTDWNVTGNQTVAGQVRDLIAADSPLQQQARTRAMQAMNGKGLMNSSMAVQAGQAAMYDAALQIAQADAATQARSAAWNAEQRNQFRQSDVNALNEAGKFNTGIKADMTRDAFSANAQRDAAFEKSYNDMVSQVVGAANDQSLALLKHNLTQSGIGQEQSIEVAKNLQNTITNIQMNSALTEESKRMYIQDAINNANTALDLIHQASGMVGGLLYFGNNPGNSGSGTGGTGGTDAIGRRIAGQNGNPPATQSTFDAQAYYAENPDVASSSHYAPVGSDLSGAWRHYSESGKNEGRPAYLL